MDGELAVSSINEDLGYGTWGKLVGRIFVIFLKTMDGELTELSRVNEDVEYDKSVVFLRTECGVFVDRLDE